MYWSGSGGQQQFISMGRYLLVIGSQAIVSFFVCLMLSVEVGLNYHFMILVRCGFTLATSKSSVELR